MKEKVVVIGFGVAGQSCVYTLLRGRGKVKVVAIDREKSGFAVNKMLAPLVIAGLARPRHLLRAELLRYLGIEAYLGFDVKRIDPDKKKVLISRHGSCREITYGKLVIATGFSVSPPLNINEKRPLGVYPINSYREVLKAAKDVEYYGKPVLLGGNPVSVSTALFLLRAGLETTIITTKPYLLWGFVDKDISFLVKKELERRGIEVKQNAHVEGVKGVDRVEGLTVDGETLKCSVVIVYEQEKPNVNLLKGLGVKLGFNGGALVNEYMETNFGDIFAVGRCVEVRNKLFGGFDSLVLAPAASKQGLTAGYRILGVKRPYDGSVNAFIISTPYLEVGGVGLTTEKACELGYNPVAVSITCYDRDAPRMRGLLKAKLLIDRKTTRILGFQVIGWRGILNYLNVISFAIKHGAKLEDLFFFEHAYSPIVSRLYTPIHVLLRRALEVVS